MTHPSANRSAPSTGRRWITTLLSADQPDPNINSLSGWMRAQFSLPPLNLTIDPLSRDDLPF